MALALPNLLVSRVELYITVFSGEVFEWLIGGVTGTCEDDGGHRDRDTRADGFRGCGLDGLGKGGWLSRLRNLARKSL